MIIIDICNNKLSTHNIPKKYLSNKQFSYKLYINLCYICFWKYDLDTSNNKFIEYRLFNYNLKELSDLFNLSKDSIKNKLKMKPYRDKFDSYEIDGEGQLYNEYKYIRTKHLMYNSPKDNYVTLDSDTINELKNTDEMTIRLYLLISGMKYKSIYSSSQGTILKLIGYSDKSNTNKNKLTECTKKLIELDLIECNYSNVGVIKHITYKIKEKKGD